MDDFEELEKKYFRAKETRELQILVTSYCCPVCNARLHSYISNMGGDGCEMKAVIYCKNCKMFQAESKIHSYYDKGNVDAEAIKEVTEKVRPYIKNFGGVLDNP